MTAKVGRYPFRTYGTLSCDATFPFALEDQTLSLYPSFVFLPHGAPRAWRPAGQTGSRSDGDPSPAAATSRRRGRSLLAVRPACGVGVTAQSAWRFEHGPFAS